MDGNHISTPTACYTWYRILQALEGKLLNSPSIWAPVTILLYCFISDLPSYPLGICFAERGTGALNVRNWSKRWLLGAGGIVWRPNLPTPPMTVNVPSGYTILQVVQHLLKEYREHSVQHCSRNVRTSMRSRDITPAEENAMFALNIRKWLAIEERHIFRAALTAHGNLLFNETHPLVDQVLDEKNGTARIDAFARALGPPDLSNLADNILPHNIEIQLLREESLSRGSFSLASLSVGGVSVDSEYGSAQLVRSGTHRGAILAEANPLTFANADGGSLDQSEQEEESRVVGQPHYSYIPTNVSQLPPQSNFPHGNNLSDDYDSLMSFRGQQ